MPPEPCSYPSSSHIQQVLTTWTVTAVCAHKRRPGSCWQPKRPQLPKRAAPLRLLLPPPKRPRSGPKRKLPKRTPSTTIRHATMPTCWLCLRYEWTLHPEQDAHVHTQPAWQSTAAFTLLSQSALSAVKWQGFAGHHIPLCCAGTNPLSSTAMGLHVRSTISPCASAHCGAAGWLALITALGSQDHRLSSCCLL